jgi:hypothetical protein
MFVGRPAQQPGDRLRTSRHGRGGTLSWPGASEIRHYHITAAEPAALQPAVILLAGPSTHS